MLATLLAFARGSWGVPIAIFGAVIVAWQVDRAGQRRVGAERAKAQIEKATNNATDLGKRAAARSSAGGVRGRPIDPTTRND